MTASRLFLALGVAGALCVGGAAFAWRDYYRLPEALRPAHPRHADLRPSGRVGLPLGIAAASLFVLNLGYLARKRLAALAWLGSLRAWMAFHVFTGLAGGALVLLHAALLPRSSLGVLAVGATAVALGAGLVGRYIYAYVPRSVEGREMEREELRRRLLEHREALARLGVGGALLQEPPHEVGAGPRGLLARLRDLLAGNREVRREYRRLRAEVLRRPELRPLAPRVLPLARRFCREQQWLARYAELRGLMGSWRFLHRWLAVFLLAVVALHVALAIRYGDLRLPEAFAR